MNTEPKHAQNGKNVTVTEKTWDRSLESSRHSTLTLKFPLISPGGINIAITGRRDGENATIINVIGDNGTDTHKVEALFSRGFRNTEEAVTESEISSPRTSRSDGGGSGGGNGEMR